MKRKAITQGQGSSSIRPRYAPPQGTTARPGGGQRSQQRPAQQTPQATPQAPHTRQAAPLAPRRDLLAKAQLQALHASSVVRLVTMLMSI
jgi:hypothetical protein